MTDSEIIPFFNDLAGMASQINVFYGMPSLKKEEEKIYKQIRSKLRHICVRFCSRKLKYMIARYSTAQ